jgi:hypothetical protein
MSKAKETAKRKAPSKRPAGSKPKASPKTKEPDKPLSKDVFCSFCGKSSEDSRRMIAGPNNVNICDECVEVCNKILLEESGSLWRRCLIEILVNEGESKKSANKKDK